MILTKCTICGNELRNKFCSDCNEIDYEEDFLIIKEKWTPSVIEKYENKISFDHLSYSTKVEWSEEFLLKYKDKFSTWGLSKNKSIGWNSKLLTEFKEILTWDVFSKHINFNLLNQIGRKYTSRHGGHDFFNFLIEFKEFYRLDSLSKNDSLGWDIIAGYLISCYDTDGVLDVESLPAKLNDYTIKFLWTTISIKSSINRGTWIEIKKKCLGKLDLYYLCSARNFPWDKALIDANIDSLDWGNLIVSLKTKYSYSFIERDEYLHLLEWKGSSWGRTGYHHYAPSKASTLNISYSVSLLKEKTKNWKSGLIYGDEASDSEGDWMTYSQVNQFINIEILIEFKNELHFPYIVKQQCSWGEKEIKYISQHLEETGQLGLLSDFIKNRSVQLYIARQTLLS